MPVMGSEREDEMLEECMDELDAALDKLDRFPPLVIAFALRAHLLALLSALRANGQIGDEQVRELLRAGAAEQPDDDGP
jgi:hypothetical protein